MTGFGEASRQNDSLAVGVEVRTINSRYFKLTVRSGEGYAALEPQIDALVRQHIKRGTVQVIAARHAAAAGRNLSDQRRRCWPAIAGSSSGWRRLEADRPGSAGSAAAAAGRGGRRRVGR